MTEITLFDNAELQENYDTCRSCQHRQRWKCNSKIIQYCGVRESNRTDNGLLKIKCNMAACSKFKKEDKKT